MALDRNGGDDGGDGSDRPVTVTLINRKEVKMKKVIVSTLALVLLTVVTGCTVLTPSGEGYNSNSYDRGSFGGGGHSHH